MGTIMMPYFLTLLLSLSTSAFIEAVTLSSDFVSTLSFQSLGILLVLLSVVFGTWRTTRTGGFFVVVVEMLFWNSPGLLVVKEVVVEASPTSVDFFLVTAVVLVVGVVTASSRLWCNNVLFLFQFPLIILTDPGSFSIIVKLCVDSGWGVVVDDDDDDESFYTTLSIL